MQSFEESVERILSETTENAQRASMLSATLGARFPGDFLTYKLVMQVIFQSFSTAQRVLLFIPIFLLSIACSAFKTASKSHSSKKRTTAVEVMQFRQDVAGWAKNYVGTKYHYAGTSSKTGFDCSGFTSHVLKEFDIKVSASSATQSTQGIKVPIKEAKPGDLIFGSTGAGGESHLAGEMLNTTAGSKTTLAACTKTRSRVDEPTDAQRGSDAVAVRR